MSANIHSIRLSTIERNFRHDPRVLRADRDFKALHGDRKKLDDLLRNHVEKDIKTNYEVQFRNDMDFLIGYYSIIAAGTISGYLGPVLPEGIRFEADMLLNNDSVRRYFEKYYPLLLPQIFRKFMLYPAGQERQFPWQDATGFDNNGEVFESALLLRRSRIDDDDIDVFLFLLDAGFYEKEGDGGQTLDIEYLWHFLQNAKNVYFLRDNPDRYKILNNAVWGFTKYIEFLNEYAALVKRASSSTFEAAAIWHLEGYWFQKLQEHIGPRLEMGLRIVSDAIEGGRYVHLEEEIDNDTLQQWRTQSQQEIALSFQNIKYLSEADVGRKLYLLL